MADATDRYEELRGRFREREARFAELFDAEQALERVVVPELAGEALDAWQEFISAWNAYFPCLAAYSDAGTSLLEDLLAIVDNSRPR